MAFLLIQAYDGLGINFVVIFSPIVVQNSVDVNVAAALTTNGDFT